MKARKPQRGFTLVELMVSVTLGLLILSAMLAFFSSNLRANSTTLELSRLNQELQTVMNMMARDIRRAGYRGDALENRDIGDRSFMFIPAEETADGTGWVHRHLSGLSGTDANGGPYQCIVLMADLDNDGTVTPSEDISGYRLSGTLVNVGRWSSVDPTCDNGIWEALTSNDLEITQLDFLLDPALELGTSRLIQSVEVVLTGNVASRPELSLTLRQRVRLRNNIY
ncbi:PilW family protein [Ferrimonas gelatinilytica]|uniref:Type IV pilin n=1 Tax=Ferrimonas gelatinilytica TaxID=1255257 RepID=A0ABP9SC44_9GAMM